MPDKNFEWFSRRPWDRHCGIMLAAGIAYTMIGLVYIIDQQSQAQTEVMYYALRIMSFDGWGVGFVTIGLCSIISSVWPNWTKPWGYVALTGWSSAWAMFYIVGAIQAEARIVYFSTGALWGLLAFLWWGVSGLVSPPKNEGVL